MAAGHTASHALIGGVRTLIFTKTEQESRQPMSMAVVPKGADVTFSLEWYRAPTTSIVEGTFYIVYQRVFTAGDPQDGDLSGFPFRSNDKLYATGSTDVDIHLYLEEPDTNDD